MLSYLEGVTNAEIAGIVDRSPARVRHELDRGLATLGGDPTRYGPRWTSQPGIRQLRRSIPSLPAARQDGRAGDAGSDWPESLSERSQLCC